MYRKLMYRRSLLGYYPGGLAWDGRYLWYVREYTNAELGNEIYQLDTSGNVISHFTAPSFGSVGLTWDGSYLWVADAVDDKVYKLDTSGNVLDSFDAPWPSSIGLTYVTQVTPPPETGGTSFDDAIALSDGQTLSGDIDKDEEVYYKFYLSAGQRATVTLQPLEGDQDLYIFNPKRHPIEVRGNSGTETEECTFTADTGGWYYAKVHGYEAGSYTITLPI